MKNFILIKKIGLTIALILFSLQIYTQSTTNAKFAVANTGGPFVPNLLSTKNYELFNDNGFSPACRGAADSFCNAVLYDGSGYSRVIDNLLSINFTTVELTTLKAGANPKIRVTHITQGGDYVVDYLINQVTFNKKLGTPHSFVSSVPLGCASPTTSSILTKFSFSGNHYSGIEYTWTLNGERFYSVENLKESEFFYVSNNDIINVSAYHPDYRNSELGEYTVLLLNSPNVTSVDGENQSFCGTAIFNVNGSHIDNIKWFNDASGSVSNLIGTGNNFNYDISNLSVGSNSVYYHIESNDGCETELVEIPFTKLNINGNISTTSLTEYCQNDTVNITLSSVDAVSYEWFEDALMNIQAPAQYIFNNGQSFSYTTTSTGDVTWYYRGKDSSGCYTQLYSIDIETLLAPSNLDVTNEGATFCTNENATFQASALNGSNYTFYKNTSGLEWESSYVSSNTLSVPSSEFNLGQNSFWVKASTNNGCTTELKRIDFTINEAPNNPLQSSGSNEYCNGNLVNITIFSNNADSYEWAYDSSFNNLVENSKIANSDSSHLQYTSNVVGETDYYFRALKNGCYSNTNSLTVTINAQVGVVTVANNGATYFQNDIVELIAGATNATSDYLWFTDANGTIPASNITGSNDNTFRLVTDENTPQGTYNLYVRATNASNCNSELTTVTYTINSISTGLQVTGDTDYCTNETVLLTPSANNASSYQWSYDTNFNNLVEASKINAQYQLTYLASSSENTIYYYRAVSPSGGFSDVENVTVEVLGGVSNLTITNNNSAVCADESLTFVASAINATSYKFYNQNGTEVSNSNALTIENNSLTAGTYNYQVRAFNTNGCTSDALSFTFDILPVPNIPSIGGTLEYCQNEIVSLTAASSGATKFEWYTDALLNNQISTNISGAKNENYSFTAANVGTTTYYVVAKNNENCTSDVKSVTVTIQAQVGAVTVTNNNNVYCQSDIVELIAGATNATSNYLWFTDANGTIPASNITGSNDNTFRLVTDENTPQGIYNLYVRATNTSNCNSELTTVTYTINSIPTELKVTGDTEYCLGDTVELLATSTNADYFVWYLDNNQINEINSNWYNSVNGASISYTPTTIGRTNLYYKSFSNSGCESSLKLISIDINQVPTQLDVTNNNKTFCSTEIGVFEAAAFNVSQFHWYKNQEGTLPVEIENINGSKNNRMSIDMSILSPGTYQYFLVAENSSGCKTEPLEVNFEIFSVPFTASVSGETEICVGENLDISVESSGSTSYNWYHDAAKNFPLDASYIFNNGKNISIPANSEQTDFIYVEGVNSNGCTTDLISFQYIFNSAPNSLNVFPINQTVCVGDKIEIDAGAENFSEFLWWKDMNATIPFEQEKVIGTANNKVLFSTTILDVGETTIYVQAKNNSGCLTEVIPVTYTVLHRTEIDSISLNATDNQYLSGEPIELLFTALNFEKYRILKDDEVLLDWQDDNTVNSYLITDTATTDDEGIYTLEISNNFCSTSETIELYVLDENLEILHDQVNNIKSLNDGTQIIEIIQGDYITFKTTELNSIYKLDWDFGDSFINTGNQVTHYFNIVGTFTVKLNITNTINDAKRELILEIPISVLPDETSVELNDLSIQENAEIDFYPNPIISNFTLKMKLPAATDVVLRIYDVNGIVYFVESFIGLSGENEYKWNNALGSAPAGIYLANITYDGTTKTFKLIKK